MNLEELFGGSFVNWEVVGGSWSKRTVPSRLLLLAARRYLVLSDAAPDSERARTIESARLPGEIGQAFASPPEPASDAAGAWGAFVDAALAAELEMVSYGERPPVLHELRTGLRVAVEEAGPETPLGRWFRARHDALPGADLPEEPDYLPV